MMAVPLPDRAAELGGVAQSIERELRRLGTPKRAAGEKRYQRTSFFVGSISSDLKLNTDGRGGLSAHESVVLRHPLVAGSSPHPRRRDARSGVEHEGRH